MNSKSPFQSKTILLNGIFGFLSFCALFTPGAESIKTFIDAHATEIGIFWSVANVILRVITKERISLTD